MGGEGRAGGRQEVRGAAGWWDAHTDCSSWPAANSTRGQNHRDWGQRHGPNMCWKWAGGPRPLRATPQPLGPRAHHAATPCFFSTGLPLLRSPISSLFHLQFPFLGTQNNLILNLPAPSISTPTHARGLKHRGSNTSCPLWPPRPREPRTQLWAVEPERAHPSPPALTLCHIGLFLLLLNRLNDRGLFF